MSQGGPVLVEEQGRLAMYFLSNASGTRKQTIRYLYSTNPFSSTANGNWGGSPDDATNGYSGISGTITIKADESTSTPTADVETELEAVSYQGRTVLAFNSYKSSIDIGNLTLLTQVASAPSATNLNQSLSWVSTDIPNPLDLTRRTYVSGLATDQSLLYITTYSDSSATIQTDKGIQSVEITVPFIASLRPSDSQAGSWSIDPTNAQISAWGNTINQEGVKPFLANGRLMGAWNNQDPLTTGGTLQITDLGPTISPPTQSSLAGFSLDGNIDINGDGFKDILLSDPSNPKQNVDNQYALFGGDYLNIASQVGTSGDDVIVGTPLADVIYTIQGADRVISNGGVDVIYTGAGDDSIAIQDNAFIRIDAGSGFDSLQLQGQANQSYDFRLNLDIPEYFPGTQLRDIELISSIDYGANLLDFDAAAINAINPDRVLFLTPDASDTISLASEFKRNPRFDTRLGGNLWSAYAAGEQSDPASSNPALIYVAAPSGQTREWIEANVNIVGDSTDAALLSTKEPALLPASLLSDGGPFTTARSTARPVPTLPLPSAIASRAAFGRGLLLAAYRNEGSAGARFAIQRNDTSTRQVIAYAATGQGGTAKPGLDFSPALGVVVLEIGEAMAEIQVPFSPDALRQRRGGKLGLEVKELVDVGQKSKHLVFLQDPSTPESPAAMRVLSGLNVEHSDDGASTRLRFRADTQPSGAGHFGLTVVRRGGAADPIPTASTRLSISDLGGLAGHDLDGTDNGQVALEFLLDHSPAAAAVSLKRRDGQWTPLRELAVGDGPVQPPTPPDPPAPGPEPGPGPISPPSTLRPALAPGGQIRYALINQGRANFRELTSEQASRIDWSRVDFESLADSPASARSLDASLINYRQLQAPAFAALAEFLSVDQLTGRNILQIGANPQARGSFSTFEVGQDQRLVQIGGDRPDLFLVRARAELVATGKQGDDLFYATRASSRIEVRDFRAGDCLKLAGFSRRDLLDGTLMLRQTGADTTFWSRGTLVASLQDVDKDDLRYLNQSFCLPTPSTTVI
jgi:hypothetical protein